MLYNGKGTVIEVDGPPDATAGANGLSMFYCNRELKSTVSVTWDYRVVQNQIALGERTLQVGDLFVSSNGWLYQVTEMDDNTTTMKASFLAVLAIAGADGADGKSAYQIALDNGFEGSEAEWLESLKAVADEIPLLPEVTNEDNGKILRVVDGVWTAVEADSGESDTTLLFDGVLTAAQDVTTGEWDPASTAKDTSDATLIVGKTYRYMLFGESYEAECFSFDGLPVIGNPAIGGGVDNGQPCVIVRDAAGVASGTPIWMCMLSNLPADYNGEVALQIYEVGESECKLPEVTEADNGKMLQCVNGVWVAVDVTTQVETICNNVINEALGGEY